jgi:hypothetical protein
MEASWPFRRASTLLRIFFTPTSPSLGSSPLEKRASSSPVCSSKQQSKRPVNSVGRVSAS